MQRRHQGQHNYCFEGHPKHSHRQGHLSPWTTAASTPFGDLLLHDGHDSTSGGHSALPATRDIGVLGDTSFGSFAEHIDVTRQRLANLFAGAERMSKQSRIDEKEAVELLAAIQRAAFDLRSARESGLGWQDIHADDVNLSLRCRRSCGLLLAALDQQRGSQRPVVRVASG